MNRRHFLIALAGAAVASAFVFKPKDSGASYSPYFSDLNEELKKYGPFKPSMVVDLDMLDQNITALMTDIDERIKYRIVAKSLPSPELLGHIMKTANTNRLMLFHQPFINHVAEAFPKTDILLGKPMPVKSAQLFYEKFSNASGFIPSNQLQWLIDTKERLLQYHSLAKKMNEKLLINVELDVGLHRGGLKEPDELIPMLDEILADPKHLAFAGLMGYDPHVVKLPKILKSPETAYEESQASYQSFIDVLKNKYPQIDINKLCLNGAGSPTVKLHKSGTVINDMAAGSCLVKPTDFDISTLQSFVPAAYVATPVLKKFKDTSIPSAEGLKGLFSWWDPNMEQTFFIYGGKWMADYESPQGLQNNSIYGASTNQAMVNGSNKIKLDVDDHIFLRPHQSEFVFLQFGDLLAVKDGKIVEQWPILKQ
ncbi:MAG: DSD1 family PLP-dependent enzyme [Deltaproteobacteria bacterium]|nr:DSD1 family PLP-dependent enzyme [Deltaproteobacteria bacterium]